MEFRSAQLVHGRGIVVSALVCLLGFVVISVATAEETTPGFVVRILSKGVKTRPICMKFLNSESTPRMEQALEIDPTPENVPMATIEQTIYKELYPGIDLIYYKNAGKVFYDLVITPGGDPDSIRIVYEGFENVELTANLPAYQVVGGSKVRVPVAMTLASDSGYRLAVGNYNHEFDLVIPTTSVPVYARGRTFASLK